VRDPVRLPPIEGVEADLVLVTHEHRDHNAVDVIGGSAAVLRSTAGRLQSAIGEVVAIASEHDDAAGTERGPTRSSPSSSTGSGSATSATSAKGFASGAGRRDRAGRPAVHPGRWRPTIDAEQAAQIVERLGPAGSSLCTIARPGSASSTHPNAFVERMERIAHLDSSRFDTGALDSAGARRPRRPLDIRVGSFWVHITQK
jgi:hypothetical protein